jgi:hypothetical protein
MPIVTNNFTRISGLALRDAGCSNPQFACETSDVRQPNIVTMRTATRIGRQIEPIWLRYPHHVLASVTSPSHTLLQARLGGAEAAAFLPQAFDVGDVVCKRHTL